MTRLRISSLLALASFSCGGEGVTNGPPIDPSTSLSSAGASAGSTAGTSADGETSSGDTGLEPCDNYLGCVLNTCEPNDADCESECEAVADVDGQACATEYCDALISMCGIDNTGEACTEHAMFCTGDGSSTTTAADSSSSDGSSSTTATEPDPCDGYFGCTLACDATPKCLETCAALYEDVDAAACEMQRCEELKAECSPDNQDACDALFELCPLDATTSDGDSGSGSGSSDATG